MIHNLDTPEKKVLEFLEGKTIIIGRSIQGRPMRPKKVTVLKAHKVGAAKTGGKAVLFTDTDQKDRTINLREITEIR